MKSFLKGSEKGISGGILGDISEGSPGIFIFFIRISEEIPSEDHLAEIFASIWNYFLGVSWIFDFLKQSLEEIIKKSVA